MASLATKTNTKRPSLPLPPQVLARKRREKLAALAYQTMLISADLFVSVLLLAWLLLHLHAWQQPLPADWLQDGTLSLRILDRDGHYLAEEPAENGRLGAWLPEKKLPTHIKLMTLAAEDHRIAAHTGVDPWAIARALVGNISAGKRVSGASTLAMQLARLLRPAPRTYTNKIQESYWALVLQHTLGAKGVIREYLNRAPYGNRVQGVQRAALLYFDRPAADLSLGQAAFLAALPWGPGLLNPFHKRGRRLAQQRAHRILRRAMQLGYISRTAYQEALLDPIKVQPKPKRVLEAIHFTEHIRRAWRKQRTRLALLCKKHTKACPQKAQEKRITEVTTTLDLSLQRKAAQALRERLLALPQHPTGAVTVLNHKTGEWLAYVGSSNYFSKESRGAINFIRTPRAPGSTLKPFVFAQAIQEQGLTGATLLQDLARAYLWRKGVYQPRNHDARFLGPVRLRKALGNSRNIPVLNVLSRLGVSQSLRMLRSMGLASLTQNAEHYGLGLALGNAEVPLFELTLAYAILAQDGRTVAMKWAHQAVDSTGQTSPPSAFLPQLFRTQNTADDVLPELRAPAARLIKHILADPLARLPSFGRYGHLSFPMPVAVKTGTSQGHRDVWMMAISDRLVVGCWLGYHDRRKMGQVYGAKGCGPIVQKVMKAAMERVEPHTPAAPHTPPLGWRSQQICPLSGMPVGPHCPGTTSEWFPPGHKHTHSTCPFHKTILIDKRNGLRAPASCQAYSQSQMIVQLPSAYATWSHQMGLPRVPRRWSPLCRRRHRAKAISLEVRRPLHQARFLIDPTIPPEYATIPLELSIKGRPKAIRWFDNGVAIGKVGWPYAMRWPLKPGVHRFWAESLDGAVRSRPVMITVRAP